MIRRWAVAALLVVAGCGEAPGPPPAPEAIGPGDECNVCGMLIDRFPGPKGQAFVRGRAAPLKFCSTRDLFAWLLQPETAAVLRAAYVHDMGATPWERPDDAAWVEAARAWFVVGSERRGAMGPTLASFARRAAAEAFAARHGGRVLPYGAVDMAVLAGLDVPPAHHHPGHRDCPAGGDC